MVFGKNSSIVADDPIQILSNSMPVPVGRHLESCRPICNPMNNAVWNHQQQRAMVALTLTSIPLASYLQTHSLCPRSQMMSCHYPRLSSRIGPCRQYSDVDQRPDILHWNLGMWVSRSVRSSDRDWVRFASCAFLSKWFWITMTRWVALTLPCTPGASTPHQYTPIRI